MLVVIATAAGSSQDYKCPELLTSSNISGYWNQPVT